jgi:YggT family protein
MLSLNGNPLCILVQLYVVVLFARAILSWFPLRSDSPFVPVARFLNTITEPVLAPFRRIIPPMGMFDVSFIIVLLLFQIVIKQIVCSLF